MTPADLDGLEVLLKGALAAIEKVPGKAHYALLDEAEHKINLALITVARRAVPGGGEETASRQTVNTGDEVWA